MKDNIWSADTQVPFLVLRPFGFRQKGSNPCKWKFPILLLVLHCILTITIAQWELFEYGSLWSELKYQQL